MKKTRMISVIAASLLTATVVFTGCGGGGSSVTVSSSSSSVSSSSSSSSTPVSSSSSSTPVSSSSSSTTSSPCLPGQPCAGGSSSATPTIKTVKVSDGYVLQATVKCKETNGNDIAQAAATNNPGEYQFVNVASCPVLCARDGVIDVNANGQVDAGEPYAPKMTAPGSYTNINPFTLLIQNGMTPAEVAKAFGLPADTNFDVAIPEASAEVQKNAVLLSALLSCIEKHSASTRDILPTPGAQESQQASSVENSILCVNSITELVTLLKSGKTIEDVLPSDLLTLKNQLDSAESGVHYDELGAQYLVRYNGAYGVASSSSVSSSSSSTPSGTGGILPAPGETGSSVPATENETSVSVSSSETSSVSSVSSVTSSETSTSSATTCLPGQPCGSSSEESSSSVSVSSSEVSSTSSSSLPAFPGGNGSGGFGESSSMIIVSSSSSASVSSGEASSVSSSEVSSIEESSSTSVSVSSSEASSASSSSLPAFPGGNGSGGVGQSSGGVLPTPGSSSSSVSSSEISSEVSSSSESSSVEESSTSSEVSSGSSSSVCEDLPGHPCESSSSSVSSSEASSSEVSSSSESSSVEESNSSEASSSNGTGALPPLGGGETASTSSSEASTSTSSSEASTSTSSSEASTSTSSTGALPPL